MSKQTAAASESRFEVSALIGPCTVAEAVEFTEELAEVTRHVLGRGLGAVWGFQKVEDDDA